MSLTVDIDQAPLILCGPMLRRTTPDSVSVFVALKQACEVELLIRATSEPASEVINSTTNNGEPAVRTLSLGQNLHILCITLNGPDPFLYPGRVYGYDLVFTPIAGGASQTLKDSGLLQGEFSLGYRENHLIVRISFC